MFGTDGAEQEVKRLTKEAVDELKNLSCPGDKIFLEELFESLTSRKRSDDFMLEKIQKPNDIKKIPADQLPALCRGNPGIYYRVFE